MNAEWAHTLVETGAILVPLWIYMRRNGKAAKGERERLHQENQRKLDDIISERQWLRPHEHTETAGNLTVEGIRFRPGEWSR